MISAASDLSHKSLFAARAEELEEILLREGIFLDEVLSLIEGVPKPRSITRKAARDYLFWIADLSIESYKPTKSRLEFALDVASGDFKDSEPKDTESVAKNYDFFIRMATKYNLRSKARRLVKDALNLIAENYSMVNSEISIDALERGCRIFVETLQRYDLKDLVLRYIRKSETLSMQIPDAHSMMAARR